VNKKMSEPVPLAIGFLGHRLLPAAEFSDTQINLILIYYLGHLCSFFNKAFKFFLALCIFLLFGFFVQCKKEIVKE